MNGNTMLEGMGYIDEKYVNEAETQGRTRHIPWIRWTVAAAFAGVLMVGAALSGMDRMQGLPGNPFEQFISGGTAAREEGDSVPVSVEYFRMNSPGDGAVYPDTEVIRSQPELEMYISRHLTDSFTGRPRYDFSGYDAAFFAGHVLIVVALAESSGSNRHEITAVTYSDGVWEVSVRRILPGNGMAGTDDMAWWYIFIETDTVSEFDRVELNVTTGRN